MIELQPDCPPACATLVEGLADTANGGWLYPPAHASGCVHREQRKERAWCNECHTWRGVVETSREGHLTSLGEVEYLVVRMSCGHDRQEGERIIGPAPGAPYAGTKGYSNMRSFARRLLHRTETDL